MGVSLHGRRHKSTTLLKSIFDSKVQTRASIGLKVIITTLTVKNRGHWRLHVRQDAAPQHQTVKNLTRKSARGVYVPYIICFIVYIVIHTATTLAATGGGERVNFGCSIGLRQIRVVICFSRACRRSGKAPPTPPCTKPYIVGFDTANFLVK